MDNIINLIINEPIITYCVSESEIYVIKNNAKKIEIYDFFSSEIIREFPLKTNNHNLKITTGNNYILLQNKRSKNVLEISLYNLEGKEIKSIVYTDEIIINHYFDIEGFAILTDKKIYFHKYLNETSTCLNFDKQFKNGLLYENKYTYYDNGKMMTINTNNLLRTNFELPENLEPHVPMTFFKNYIYFFSQCKMTILNKNNFKFVNQFKTDINFKSVSAPYCISGKDLFIYDRIKNKLIFVFEYNSDGLQLSNNPLISYKTTCKENNEHSIQIFKPKFIKHNYLDIYDIDARNSVKTKNLKCNGAIIMNDIRYPFKDGSKNSCLTTDGKGNLSFNTIKGSGDIMNNGQGHSVVIGSTNKSPVSIIENNKEMITLDNEQINLYATTKMKIDDCSVVFNGDRY